MTYSAGRVVETLCWGLGLALVTLYGGARANGEIERRQGIAAYSETRLPAAAEAGRDGAEIPIAVLRIGSLHVEVPVYTDSSEYNLNRGAGLIAGTARPGSGGNVAIAAHRDGYFRALKNAAIGDVIELESRWESREYRITELTIVEPTDIWPLDDTDVSMVTLVTCYPFYFVGSAPQRFIVRAVAIESS